MKKQKTYICERCKEEVNESDFYKSYNMCDTCYAEIWDAGFSSQADYSDKLFEIQLQEEWEANEKMNKKKDQYSNQCNQIKRFFQLDYIATGFMHRPDIQCSNLVFWSHKIFNFFL